MIYEILIIFIVMVLLMLLTIFLYDHLIFKKSLYHKVSGNNIYRTLFDKGLYGEYLIYDILTRIPGYKMILTNVFLPMGEGRITELDLVYIHETGIYVLESKNYRGYIYGKERNSNWMQIFNRHKETHFPFLNPIIQNERHIMALSSHLPNIEKEIFKSYIVFGTKANIKKVEGPFKKAWVGKIYQLELALYKDIINNETVLSFEEIEKIYHELEVYSNVDQKVKEEHARQAAILKSENKPYRRHY